MKLHLNLRPIRLFLAVALTAGACATTGNGEGGGRGSADQGVAIEVDNTVVGGSDVSVYVVSGTATRRLIGTVPPNRTATLNYNGPTTGGQFRLVARPTGGREIVSNPIGLTGVTRVRWSLQSNVAAPVD